ncbi:MAG: hypothetical protein IKO46_06735 [Salinivirgaceae bacterium]|nr:hypothetical protein [Salinivirgaceae bacterium]
MDELTTKRLAVIKQLYLHGVDQSYEAEPMNGFSILSFHDSVEMFMKLCAEVKDVKIDRNVKFVEYFTKLPDMLCEATMTNLNSKRVNLKHYGSLPSQLDIEISRANVADFFEQNTPLFFNVNFNDISLISLISYKEVRDYLVEAQDALSKNDFEISIQNSQIAFKELLVIHKEENSIRFNSSPFRMTQDFSFLNSFFMGIRKDNKKMGEFVDRVGKSFEEMENTVSIIGFGIDYKKYCKFRLLEPIMNVFRDEEKRNYEVFNGLLDNRICDKKNAQFCFNFVIDSALKLQKFNMDIWGTIKK